MVIARFDVFLVQLDPTRGSEIRKTRPCVVISPDEINESIRTVIVAPMTTAGRPYPSRVAVTFDGRSGRIVLDQVLTVDKTRLMRHLGHIDQATAAIVLDTLARLFAP